ncbi:MAG: hypothetical protein R2713_17760 [Ilumatobacteraceae bacterium]
MLSGRLVPAADAHRIGLVDDLVEPDALVATAIATAGRMRPTRICNCG